MRRARLAPLALATALGCGARTDLAAFSDAAPADVGLDVLAETAPEAAVDASSDVAPDATQETSFGECSSDADCALRWTCDVLRCVDHACASSGTSRCDDGDPCTIDGCDAASATCTHAPSTLDADGDGHRAARPGTLPGAPGACGDDCDDGNASVHPGARELCNGLDDDCNGLVDDGVSYVASGAETSIAPAGALDSAATTLASFPGGFAALIDHHPPGTNVNHVAMTLLDPSFARTAPDLDLGKLFGRDAFGAGIAWAGDRFGVTWVHTSTSGDGLATRFALLDSSNRYRGPGDIALFDPGWDAIGSLWTGYEFLVPATTESTTGTAGFGFDLHAAPVSALAVPGSDLALPGITEAQWPSLSLRPSGGFLAAWNETDATSTIPAGHVRVAPVNEALTTLGAVRAPIAPLVSYQSAAVMLGKFAYVAAISLDGSVHVAAFDPDTGTIAASATPFVGGAAIARDANVTPIGARVMVSWADDHDDGTTFEVYVQVHDAALKPIGAPQRISHAVGNSRMPLVTTLGGTADGVVVWYDARNGAKPQAYARKLLCAAP